MIAASSCTHSHVPDLMSDIDQLWDDLLSEEPARIRRLWYNLTDDEGKAVLAHLRRMRDEPDWHPDQKRAAAAALRAIEEAANRF
jgi:hypothetical protein